MLKVKRSSNEKANLKVHEEKFKGNEKALKDIEKALKGDKEAFKCNRLRYKVVEGNQGAMDRS